LWNVKFVFNFGLIINNELLELGI